MEFEVQKYECNNKEYMVYDCNRYDYKFGEREARVMCSQSVGLETTTVIVGPVIEKQKNDISVILFNPDGTKAEPTVDAIRVFSKYLTDSGYERTPRSDSGAVCDDDVKKVCKMAFFENFTDKYDLRKEVEKDAE